MPPLMLSRRFAPLFCCQFFAAFNDNFLKTALVFLILFRRGGADAAALITLASAMFIAPYFFLSALGGELADRYDKARVAQWLKFVEMFVAALAVARLCAAVGADSVRRARRASASSPRCSGRSNTASCPIIWRARELPAGNALVEGATFIAILTGTIVGGLAARGGDVLPFSRCW